MKTQMRKAQSHNSFPNLLFNDLAKEREAMSFGKFIIRVPINLALHKVYD